MRVAIGAVILALSACAADTLRIERANSLSTQAATTVAAARAYVADVQARRREGAVALVASDPSCLWGPSIVVDAEWKGRRGLCDLRGVPANRRATLNLQSVSPDALRTLTTAIAGIAAYQGALAEVLEERPDEAKETIATAIDTLSTAAGDLNRIVGEKTLDLGPLTGARAGAVVALVGTLDAMRQTNLKVASVRRVVAGADAEALIGALDEGAARLGSVQDGNSALYRLTGLTAAYDRERPRLPFAERVARVRDIAAASDDVTSGYRKRLAALRSVLGDLRVSDGKLRDALADRFTPAERRRIARENRKQLFSILSQVAAIFPPL